jgi:hypothetical protein
MRGPDHMRKVIATEEKLLNAEQRQQFRSATGELEGSLRRIELQNAEKVYENALNDRTVYVFVITEPHGDQLADAFGLEKEIEGRIPKDSPVRAGYGRASKVMLDEYTWYPKPNRVLLMTAHDTRVSFAQRFATDPKDVFPKSDGTFYIGEDEPGFFLDEWGQSNGWSAERFGHLVEITVRDTSDSENPFPKIVLHSSPEPKPPLAR